MDNKGIAEAVKQICDEKGISFEAVIETIEAAMAAAYRKDFGTKNQNLKATFDIETGNVSLVDIKTVVDDVPEEELAAIEAEEANPKPYVHTPIATTVAGQEGEEAEKRFNPKTDIQISEAKELKKGSKIGDIITTQLEIPGDFGRMAAQTAKQVITQKLRETERENIYQQFKGREGELLIGTVQRREGRFVLIDLGRITAVLPNDEQIPSDNYAPGTKMKVYIVAVNQTTKGPEIVVSRSHPEIVRQLFTLEIPEIANGIVEIKAIAREAGSRTKVAVWTAEDNIDPIGSCIGQRGARIQTIISELKGEKVDIIKFSEDVIEFITQALSPAKVATITLRDEDKVAIAKVAEDQLSLAIGRGGQNVRLASRLTGWKIDIMSDGGKLIPTEEVEDTDAEATPATETVEAELEAVTENVEPKKEE